MDLTSGQQIGSYRVVRPLGRGGMGAVYEVEHMLTKVAMKQQSRDIYRAYAVEERPIDEIASTFGVSPDIVYKVKYRVEKMIEAVEEEYSEE